ncbi:MAG: hypothetical protein CMP13_09760 [Zunongwangia sp.]|uniref:Phospholipase D-like domain-containing protein n=2 Tax=Zunongwangia profunda TaxID=398743 RepID=D5BFB0_ZUNPS|nr:phospholipase D family protein [Zunongwangia profunda]ADF53008.1 conserved hypothetical protein [Zunongwangia profunda SM-A87]MAS70894.1 hypothetical protein [Zunongwangia sp.]HCV79705.1 hypothetical protein [Zunongwangia profunda]|tara:strand:+ start:268 stop:954 length:687 start_codon:yes stop_codon:yes gene_type:complete
MSQFLDTHDITNKINKLIKNASNNIYIVSPYLKISNTLYERLNDASKRGVYITIIYGKDKLNSKDFKRLGDLININIYYYHNLHAKCYFNDSEMVITSMNMYEFSEKNNREMGIYINKSNDNSTFLDAFQETKSIIDNSELKKSNLNLHSSKEKHKKQNIDSGYCIRCSKSIKHNSDKPLCPNCYKKWVVYMDVDYTENYCHTCKKEKATSVFKPECYSCFKKKKKAS